MYILSSRIVTKTKTNLGNVFVIIYELLEFKLCFYTLTSLFSFWISFKKKPVQNWLGQNGSCFSSFGLNMFAILQTDNIILRMKKNDVFLPVFWTLYIWTCTFCGVPLPTISVYIGLLHVGMTIFCSKYHSVSSLETSFLLEKQMTNVTFVPQLNPPYDSLGLWIFSLTSLYLCNQKVFFLNSLLLRVFCVQFFKTSLANPNMIWSCWLQWLYDMPSALQNISDGPFLTINHLFCFLRSLVCFLFFQSGVSDKLFLSL